jgi:Peptidase family S51
MKYLLTSAGIKNTSIHNALVELLGKPIAESNALCIPTAGYANLGGAGRAWKFITGREPETPMCELRWKSLGVLELTALPSIDDEAWIPMVQETDVLLVNGGDPLYLCYWMRQSGLADLLPELRETVWVGLSAGSMVMTPVSGRTSSAGSHLPVATRRWGSSTSRSSRTSKTRTCRKTPWPPQNGGPPTSQVRPTQLTTRPPSQSWTAPSKSSPRGAGSCLPPKTPLRP